MPCPKQLNEVLVATEDLRDGDRVYGREFHDWSTDADFVGHVVEGEALRYKGKPTHSLIPFRNFAGGGRWRVVRAFFRSAPAQALGRWNGRCKCGANTYTGFIQVEHDGPCHS